MLMPEPLTAPHHQRGPPPWTPLPPPPEPPPVPPTPTHLVRPGGALPLPPCTVTVQTPVPASQHTHHSPVRRRRKPSPVPPPPRPLVEESGCPSLTKAHSPVPQSRWLPPPRSPKIRTPFPTLGGHALSRIPPQTPSPFSLVGKLATQPATPRSPRSRTHPDAALLAPVSPPSSTR